MTDKACPTPEFFREAIGKIIFLTFLFFLSFIDRFIFAPLLPASSGDLGITTAGILMILGSSLVFLVDLLDRMDEGC